MTDGPCSQYINPDDQLQPAHIIWSNCMLWSVDHRTTLPGFFDTIGSMPSEYHIPTGPNVILVGPGHRRVPIHLCEEIKAQLQKKVSMGIIISKPTPTACISSLTHLRKANRSIHMYLNKAIICEHHKAPFLQGLTHKHSSSKFFSKLDAHDGFWSVHLKHRSSLLNTFNAPRYLSLYHYLKISFSLMVSQDVYHTSLCSLSDL